MSTSCVESMSGVVVSKSVRVFSGNLWWGRADPDGLIDLIRRNQIDVFAAQELGFKTAEAISSELPFGSLEPDNGFHGMGIALRHPARFSEIPLYYRSARRVVLEPGDWEGLSRPLDLVNVHIQAPHAIRPFPSVLVRHRQMSGLERFFKENPSDTRLVVGDYNATPLWSVYRRMALLFSDGAIQSAQRDGRPLERTWGPTARGPRMLRIDHAMVRGLQVENFQVIEIPGSDHSGLVFDCSPSVLASREQEEGEEFEAQQDRKD